MSGEIECGIYLNMPEDEYFAARALSCSGMKQLMVSPLNYWHRNLNPDYVKDEETAQQRLGKAVHCRLLEPRAYAERYAVELSSEDVPDALVTVDDLKGWLAEHNLATSAKRKQDLIDRVLTSGIPAVIWDLEEAAHAERTAGKILLDKVEAEGIEALAKVVLDDPFAAATLSNGIPEVSIFVRELETGVLLKARMDYVKAAATIDVKTFSNARGKPTDKAVFDAIYYENYHLQCVFYRMVREIARQQLAAGEIKVHGDVPADWVEAFKQNDDHRFGFVFIESSAPFDMRIVEMRRAEAAGADQNIYWTDAELRIADLMSLYRQCWQKYGENPWREPVQPRVLEDSDIPQLAFSGGGL